LIYKDIRQYESAREYTLKALEAKPFYPQAYHNLGSICWELGDTQTAEKSFLKAIEIQPDYPEVYMNLVEVYERVNQQDKLSDILTSARQHCTDKGYLILSEARQLKRENNLEAVRGLLENVDEKYIINHEHKASILNLLAKTCDELGLFDKAFKCFVQCNQTMAKVYSDIGYDKNLYLGRINRHKSISQRIGSPKVPVFLVGYPRSGTTLLDTILSSHPDITVVEEKPMVNAVLSGGDYFQELEKHIDLSEIKGLLVDKLPLNIVHSLEIKSYFPEAKFILALRHPCDCVLSSFMQNFGANEAMANMLKLEDAAYLYHKAMTIWKETGVEGYVIKYEDVVSDLERTIKPLLDYLGLEWTESITNYAETARLRGRINTPSYHQVVRPLYKTSIERWINYQKYMEPVLPILLPWAEYWGYETGTYPIYDNKINLKR